MAEPPGVGAESWLAHRVLELGRRGRQGDLVRRNLPPIWVHRRNIYRSNRRFHWQSAPRRSIEGRGCDSKGVGRQYRLRSAAPGDTSGRKHVLDRWTRRSSSQWIQTYDRYFRRRYGLEEHRAVPSGKRREILAVVELNSRS